MVRKSMLCAVAFLVLTGTVFAEGALKVFATGESSEEAKEVAQLVRGRIGSTLRYTLTDSMSGADFMMEIVCLPVSPTQEHERTLTIACSAPTEYFSSKNYNLPYGLLGVILIGDRQFIAEHLFDNFVEDTSTEKIERMDKRLSDKASQIFSDGYSAGIEAEKNRKQKAAEPPKN